MYFRVIIFFVLLGLMLYNQTHSQNLFVTKTQRENFILEKKHFVDSVFLQFPNQNNEKNFQSAFWATELMLLKSTNAIDKLKFSLINFGTFSNEFKRSVLQNIFTLYHSEFVSEIDSLIQVELNEKLYVMMSNYLIRQNTAKVAVFLKGLKRKFPDWRNSHILNAFIVEHSEHSKLTSKQINDLITFRQKKKKATLLVFVQNDRDLPGIAMVLDSNGNFLKEKNDTIKLLARSITNLSGYLTNGNTPEGVFSIKGFGYSDNVFIGPSPIVNTFLPCEISTNEFAKDEIEASKWSLKVYNSLFPKSWKNYLKKNMAFYAGKAGRSEIIIHGSTINPEYYSKERFYPFTPSLGCLCTLENWNETNGSLLESEQLKLFNLLKNNNINNALMYVIEK